MCLLRNGTSVGCVELVKLLYNNVNLSLRNLLY
jgi:hypothetical protein